MTDSAANACAHCAHCENGIVSATNRCCNRCGTSDKSDEERTQERSAEWRFMRQMTYGAIAGLVLGLSLEFAMSRVFGFEFPSYLEPRTLFCGFGAGQSAARCELVDHIMSQS